MVKILVAPDQRGNAWLYGLLLQLAMQTAESIGKLQHVCHNSLYTTIGWSVWPWSC